MFSGSSRRDICNAAVLGTGILLAVEYLSLENWSRAGIILSTGELELPYVSGNPATKCCTGAGMAALVVDTIMSMPRSFVLRERMEAYPIVFV